MCSPELKYFIAALICVVPENSHTPPPMEGICPMTPPHPSGNSILTSYTALNFSAFETPHLPSQEFPLPSVEGVWIFSGTTHFTLNVNHTTIN